MARWQPEKVWDGEDVFVIGGGPSLKDFDWDVLKLENTIGCNDAYLLGEDICKICYFSDFKWFSVHKARLAKFSNPTFTNCCQLMKSAVKNLWTMERKAYGIHKNAIGYNSNSGGAAINLAILLGAKRIFLLGFDMRLREGESNWHPNDVSKPNEEAYLRFIKGFTKLTADWKRDYSDIEIVNVTDDSNLDLFPKIGVEEFWSERLSARSADGKRDNDGDEESIDNSC